MGRTKIEWVEETLNPVTGCTPISEGCARCFARRMALRLAGRCGYPKDDPFRITYHPDRLKEPFRWRKPRMVFLCSMGDLFHEDVEYSWQCGVLDTIRGNPQHTFLILTKRAERMRDFFVHQQSLPMGMLGLEMPPSNLWLGVTAENQARADERIPVLLDIPDVVRFVSLEPLIGEIHLNDEWLRPHHDPEYVIPPMISWIIAGAENGPGRRPCKLEWVESIVEQCGEAQVPVFVKQLSINGKVSKEPNEWPKKLRKRQFPFVKR